MLLSPIEVLASFLLWVVQARLTPTYSKQGNCFGPHEAAKCSCTVVTPVDILNMLRTKRGQRK